MTVKSIIKILFLMTGGALGTLARYVASGLAHRLTNTAFPIGTMIVNCLGSLLIGMVWAFWEDTSVPGYIRTFVLIGFFGGFTTFSSLSLETMNLVRDNEMKMAIFNILANNLIGILFVFGGYFTVRWIITAIH